MQEGQTVDYLRDIRTVELAIVDRTAEKTDEHFVIPRDLFVANYKSNQANQKANKPLVYIDEASLPAKVAVVKYYENADVRDIAKDEKSPATAGRGLEGIARRAAGRAKAPTWIAASIWPERMSIQDKQGHDLGTFLPLAARFRTKVRPSGSPRS